MKILFLPKYNELGASSRYRFYNFQPFFQKNGIQPCFKPLLDGNYVINLYNNKKYIVFFQKLLSLFRRFVFLMSKNDNYDLIVIEKELFPNFPYFIEKFLLKGKSYALDFDDYIAISYKLNPYKRFFLGNKIDKLARNAKFVTVGNHWYFDEIKSNNLIYLPTVISLDSYLNVKYEYKAKVITVVWIGSMITVMYLPLVVSVLKNLAKKHPIRLKVIGAYFEIDGVEVECVPWSADTEIDEIVCSDIGIMPLEDDLFTKGKCGFKLIQYMACGLPVVASALPANLEIVDDFINGYVVKNEKEWYNSLEKLIIDESLRKKMGQAGRKKIETNYSYQVWGKRYCDLLKNQF